MFSNEGGTPVTTLLANGNAGIHAPRIPEPQTNRLKTAGQVNILVVDDDPAIGRLINAALAENDFTVHIVSDPAQVEARLKSQTYHLILLDYVIPGLKAEQVMEWVRTYQADA